MQTSFAPFLFSLILTQHLYKFCKVNNYTRWVKWFNYARYFSVFLFLTEIIVSGSNSIRWIWYIFLGSILLFIFQQKEMRSQRMFLLAFAPYVIVSILSDLTKVILSGFYERRNNYFENAVAISIIWLIAVWVTQYRQNKSAEKERIKRQKEEEINKAIAARKVELEGLVAERTKEITKQKEELEHTLNELRATQNQLIQSEKMASLGELTAGIAHEIQNPLNFVNNFSEVNSELIDELKEEIENGNLEEVKVIANDLKGNEAKIMHHGKRAESIVKGMLLHSRGSSGQKELTDLNALADEYLRLSYHGLRAKDKSFNADFKLEADESIPKIEVVPQDMGRVFLNLINNAFYAVAPQPPEGGIKNAQVNYKPTVIVKTSYFPPSGGQRGAVEIRVKDNGPGIPESIREKIFQPFFTTKPTGQGTGLGLSISYDIVKAHGGELNVETIDGEGSEFKIYLPVKM